MNHKKWCAFTSPETVRIPLPALPGEQWIEVKKTLTVEESRRVAFTQIGAIRGDGSRVPNLEALGMQGVAAYLVDWSFRDAKDKPVACTFDAIKSLTPEDYGEIDRAIDANIEAMAAEEKKKKKDQGEIAASATS